VFHAAYAVGMAAVGALLVLALIVGLIDLRQRGQATSTRSSASSAASSAADSSRPNAG
jgi:hypothetical protein